MTRYKTILITILLLALVSFCGYANGKSESESGGEMYSKSLKLYIGDKLVPVQWEENATVLELIKQAQEKDIVIQMDMYGGFEQVGSLGKTYPRDDHQVTTQCGDIVLYSGNSIVVFYGSNSWSYTKLGKMKLEESEVVILLSHGNVVLRLTVAE